MVKIYLISSIALSTPIALPSISTHQFRSIAKMPHNLDSGVAPFRFLDLPGEIRNQIYSHLCRFSEHSSSDGAPGYDLPPLHFHDTGRKEIDGLLSLMRTNQRMLSSSPPQG